MTAAPLTARQAAEYLHMHVDTFRAHVRAGEIARTGTPGKHLFLTDDLDDWLRRHRVPSKAELDAQRFETRRDPIGTRPSPERVAELFGGSR